jgi:hypothetical protein
MVASEIAAAPASPMLFLSSQSSVSAALILSASEIAAPASPMLLRR